MRQEREICNRHGTDVAWHSLCANPVLMPAICKRSTMQALLAHLDVPVAVEEHVPVTASRNMSIDAEAWSSMLTSSCVTSPKTLRYLRHIVGLIQVIAAVVQISIFLAGWPSRRTGGRLLTLFTFLNWLVRRLRFLLDASSLLPEISCRTLVHRPSRARPPLTAGDACSTRL